MIKVNFRLGGNLPFNFMRIFAPFGRRVTERNTSLHSGSIDSVQNREAKLHDFEARWRELKLAHWSEALCSSDGFPKENGGASRQGRVAACRRQVFELCLRNFLEKVP